MRILLATDGSVEADLAEAALSKFPLRDAEIVVAMVISNPGLVVMPPGLPCDLDDGGLTKLQKDVAERTVEHICARLSASGFRATPLVVQGDVAGQLLELTRSKEFDLVASGSRIEGSLKAFFLGSVSRKLALYSDCSVLVAHHYKQKLAEGSVERLHAKAKLDVLVAVDGSTGGEFAVDTLASAGQPRFGRMFVLTVEPHGSQKRTHARANTFLIHDEVAHAVAQKAAKRLAHCADEVHAITAMGRPSTAIVQVAADHDVDLVMIGANRHGAIERLMVGRCAYETVTSAPCSVMILRGSLNLA